MFGRGLEFGDLRFYPLELVWLRPVPTGPTTRNPNVFYELGLAHALKKPVVLVSSNESDVPFDLKHIRVIYYDVNDPFWGTKLLDKVAENILSAIQHPDEAVFKGEGD